MVLLPVQMEEHVHHRTHVVVDQDLLDHAAKVFSIN